MSGEVHTPQGPPSSRHSKVAPGLGLENWKAVLAALWVPDGADVMYVSGGSGEE